MKLNYHPDTDSLYIDLSAKPSAESVEVSKGVVLDYDVDGNLVGIDIVRSKRRKKRSNKWVPFCGRGVAATFAAFFLNPCLAVLVHRNRLMMRHRGGRNLRL